jgi:FixJ family two-component response regulator
MPGMDRLQFSGCLKERGFSHTAVVVTAHGNILMAVRVVKAGVFGFVEKLFGGSLVHGSGLVMRGRH